MKIIGFGGTFYTLWDVQVVKNYTTLNTAQGEMHFHSGNTTRYTYLKNLSMDREEAIRKAGTDKVDEGLRGFRTFEKTEKFDYPAEYFCNGWQRGELIAECNDVKTLIWQAGQFNNGEERQTIIDNRLIELDLVKIEGEWKTREEAKEIQERIEMFKKADEIREEAYTKYSKGGVLEFVVEKNPDSKGYVKINDVLSAKFEKVGENYYNGFTYYLPVKNGKQVRIKGKKIIANIVTVEDEYYGGRLLKITDFQVVKE